LFRSFHVLGGLFDPRRVRDEHAFDRPSLLIDGSAVGVDNSALLQRLEGALGVISSDERKTWVDFGIAIKLDLGEGGLATWLAWSRKSAKFDLDDALKTWASFKNQAAGPPITLGTVFYMAEERGWNDEARLEEVPAHIARINEHHFLAPQGGRTHIFKEGIHPLHGRYTLQAMSLPDFKALFSNDFVDSGHAREKPKRIPVAEAWLSHPKRRQYEGVLLAPNGDIPGYDNRW
jgi:hypothetical protein